MECQIHEIDSRSELLELFGRLGEPKILIEGNEGTPNQFTLIKAPSITVALCGHSHGIPIQIEELEAEGHLLLGHGNMLSCISIGSPRILWQITLESVFFRFQKLAEQKRIVVIEETGVHNLSFSGKENWSFSTDVITDWKIAISVIIIKTMDAQELRIDTHTGSLLA